MRDILVWQRAREPQAIRIAVSMPASEARLRTMYQTSVRDMGLAVKTPVLLIRAPHVRLGWKGGIDGTPRGNLRPRQPTAPSTGGEYPAPGRSRRSPAVEKSWQSQEATLNQWRYLASQKIPEVENARALWEQDKRDPDADAWRETRDTLALQIKQVAQCAQAVTKWHLDHRVQSLILRTGLLKPPTALLQLEQRYRGAVRFLEGSQERLQELEQVWTKKQPVYQQQLERKGGEIREARRNVQVVVQNRERFQQVWEREDQKFRQQRREQEQGRRRDRDREGWSR